MGSRITEKSKLLMTGFEDFAISVIRRTQRISTEVVRPAIKSKIALGISIIDEFRKLSDAAYYLILSAKV